MDSLAVLARLAVDLAALAGWVAVVGISAPRWPDRWLGRDAGPLRLTRWDTPQRYRALGVPGWTRMLPEAGSWFGGQSKSRLPGTDPAALARYLVEVRRAEWVHWLSVLGAVPAVVLGPWWLGGAVLVAVGLVNAPFLLVLRYNRSRLLRILSRSANRPGGQANGEMSA